MTRKREPNVAQSDMFQQDLKKYRDYVPERSFKPVSQKIWTKNKSLLVSAYLKQFVYITWRGVYIDGFSGPQYPEELEYWCARKVFETQQGFSLKKYGMDSYFLVEKNPEKVVYLKALQQEYTHNFKSINLLEGDINLLIDQILDNPKLHQKDPVFCLLDQHSTECHWDTVLKLASHPRPSGYKIEQFYFLATGWLPRVFGGTKKDESKNKLDLWWGDRSWEGLKNLNSYQMSELMVKRFKALGYKHVTPWPIFKEGNDESRIMYFMIHASDHDKAPQLMESAYHKVMEIRNKDVGEQLKMLIDFEEG